MQTEKWDLMEDSKKIRVIYKTIWTAQKIVKGRTLGGWKTLRNMMNLADPDWSDTGA